MLIKDCARLDVQWPLYAKDEQPIQFHLPTVCDHHLGKREDGCHIIKPDLARDPNMGSIYKGMTNCGWLVGFSAEDDLGLKPVPRRSKFSVSSRKKINESGWGIH